MLDHYATLGVPPTATEREIKSAYRRRAHEYHPDKNPAPWAEEKFKELGAAYEVLSDETKRIAYDRQRAAASMRAPAAESRRPRPSVRLGDIEVVLRLSYREAITGVERPVFYKRRDVCPSCEGLMMNVFGDACRRCKGKGYKVGRVAGTVTVPPGVITGTTLLVRGEGHETLFTTGDLRVKIKLLKQPGLVRKGVDFHTVVRVPKDVLERGGAIKVLGPAGWLRVVLPPGLRSGAKIRLPGAGLPRGGGRGALYIRLRAQG